MKRVLALLALYLTVAAPVQAAPVLKIINFTADWCPNCLVLNPRLDEAISAFPNGSIERIDLDLTAAGRGATEAQIARAEEQAARLAMAHKADDLWSSFGGTTGIAVAIAADTGEAIRCFHRPMRADDIQQHLRLAKLLVEHASPGARKPNGTNCPDPL